LETVGCDGHHNYRQRKNPNAFALLALWMARFEEVCVRFGLAVFQRFIRASHM
jgi:hypothetical protein